MSGPVLKHNRYGKSHVHVIKVTKKGETHFVQELDVQVLLTGDKLGEAYTNADNRLVVPTDTVKNTVNILAKQNATDPIEAFGVILVRHFLKEYSHIRTAQADITENFWERLKVQGKPHPHSFTSHGPAVRFARVLAQRSASGEPQVTVHSGIKNFYLFKTTGSGFENYWTDKYTTLKPARDRLFKTALKARWTFTKPDGVDFHRHYNKVVELATKVFAEEYSPSVQATLWRIGTEVINSCSEIDQIWLSAPNLHNWLLDLSPFGIKDNQEIYTPPSEPVGFIEATVGRSGSKGSKL